MKIVSSILILITVFLSLKHGWEGVSGNIKPEQATMLADMGVNKTLFFIVSLLSLAVGIMVLFPQTFFIANLINTAMILLIMAMALKAGNIKLALIEIPFLLIPLVLLYLGHPIKK